MGKGILGFIKWWWCGKLFPEEAGDSPVLISFEQAVEVSGKIAERFSGKPWLTCVGVEQDKKYGHVVFIGMNPDVLQLKPEELEYFVFAQEVDGVQVRLMTIPIAKALARFGIRP